MAWLLLAFGFCWFFDFRWFSAFVGGWLFAFAGFWPLLAFCMSIQFRCCIFGLHCMLLCEVAGTCFLRNIFGLVNMLSACYLQYCAPVNLLFACHLQYFVLFNVLFASYFLHLSYTLLFCHVKPWEIYEPSWEIIGKRTENMGNPMKDQRKLAKRNENHTQGQKSKNNKKNHSKIKFASAFFH